MSVFFLGSWGMNRSAGQTNRVNREAVLGWFVCSALRFIPHEPRKKRHSFLIFTMLPTKTLSKILREKLHIQNSHSNGHLTSLDVLITVHVIRSHFGTICRLCSSGIELKSFSRVQRRKYGTIVNIILWIIHNTNACGKGCRALWFPSAILSRGQWRFSNDENDSIKILSRVDLFVEN